MNAATENAEPIDGTRLTRLHNIVEQAHHALKEERAREAQQKEAEEAEAVASAIELCRKEFEQHWPAEFVEMLGGTFKASFKYIPTAWLEFQFEGALLKMWPRRDEFLLGYPFDVDDDDALCQLSVKMGDVVHFAKVLAGALDDIRDYGQRKQKHQAKAAAPAEEKPAPAPLPGPWLVKDDLPAAKLQDAMNAMESLGIHVRNVLSEDGGGEYSSRYTVVGHKCGDHEAHADATEADETPAPVH